MTKSEFFSLLKKYLVKVWKAVYPIICAFAMDLLGLF